MIDDNAKAMDLVPKMENQLPIPVRLGSPIVRILWEKGVAATRSQEFKIKRVFYFGYEGGIMCDVTPTEDAKEALVVSLTHFLIPVRHPQAQETRAYQRERARRLALEGGPGKTSAFTIRTREKWRC